jgi:hypothetical protein
MSTHVRVSIEDAADPPLEILIRVAPQPYLDRRAGVGILNRRRNHAEGTGGHEQQEKGDSHALRVDRIDPEVHAA